MAHFTLTGMRTMQAKLRSVDGIIEVHDARIPFSGRNIVFRDKLSLVRPHLFVLNKTDLADLTKKDEIVLRLKQEGVSEVILTDCRQNRDAAASEVSTVLQSRPTTELFIYSVPSGLVYVGFSSSARL